MRTDLEIVPTTAPAPRERAADSAPPAAGPHASVLRLQRAAGNAVVQRALVQRSAADAAPGIAPEVEDAIHAARGGGQALDGGVRAQMEGALGADFSGVRVHTDARADALSRELGARAFTTGRDVFFRQGEYSPGSAGGRRLVAHELTHVVQQSGTPVQRSLTLGPVDDAYEREADAVAGAVAAGHAAEVSPGGGSGVQRSPVQREDDGERAYAVPNVVYQTVRKEQDALGPVETFWGGVVDVADDSRFQALLNFDEPRMQDGVGELAFSMSMWDERDNPMVNDTFKPELMGKVKWEQRAGHERLVISPGDIDYKPNGGGGMQVVCNYAYGGYKEENGSRYGIHSLRFNFVYNSNLARSNSIGFEVGAEGGGASAGLAASTSATITASSLSFVREVRFRSHDYKYAGR